MEHRNQDTSDLDEETLEGLYEIRARVDAAIARAITASVVRRFESVRAEVEAIDSEWTDRKWAEAEALFRRLYPNGSKAQS